MPARTPTPTQMKAIRILSHGSSSAAISTAPKMQDCDGTSNAKNPVDTYVGDVMTVQPSWFHLARRY
ncbi:hypothetical protein BC938DRAFT_480422 [Jimgerdemannia flammicorona]|uniref:Uncharacterized protein n=1 Tax=Jimgerdemannia flammicorona TaxID=994334 RepID=A0A433QIK2_9FUNG|nr:hypothetical protein BC938DRAFT_480422 [Jimgerdemannia flammicorona]